MALHNLLEEIHFEGLDNADLVLHKNFVVTKGKVHAKPLHVLQVFVIGTFHDAVNRLQSQEAEKGGLAQLNQAFDLVVGGCIVQLQNLGQAQVVEVHNILVQVLQQLLEHGHIGHVLQLHNNGSFLCLVGLEVPVLGILQKQLVCPALNHREMGGNAVLFHNKLHVDQVPILQNPLAEPFHEVQLAQTCLGSRVCTDRCGALRLCARDR
mmetsp:Transcript_12918/g.32958  ORF Transcript_12918/g.32958 Transcript_12918/m.32958 type:complete len:209 (+) Transcript_12918:994-1620(+)